MFALFKDGKQVSKAHSTREAVMVEALEFGGVLRHKRVTWMDRGYAIREVSEIPNTGATPAAPVEGNGLAERLRDYRIYPFHAETGKSIPTIVPITQEAADRIERLEAALIKYRDALCEYGLSFEGCGKLSEDVCSGCLARAALAGKE